MLKIINNSSNYEPLATGSSSAYKKQHHQQQASPLGVAPSNRILSSPSLARQISAANDNSKYKSLYEQSPAHVVSLNRYGSSRISQYGGNQTQSVSSSDNDSKDRMNSKLAPVHQVPYTNTNNNTQLDSDGAPSSKPAIQHTPAKLNKDYLLNMKKKHKFKISANISGTKFDISR